MNSENRIWFVNRFFYPDHSATSQIVSDLAFHLAGQGRQIGVIASRGVYDDPQIVLPAFENHGGVAIHRVARARFGRSKLLGRAIDYAGMYAAFAAATARLTNAGDRIVVKSDPPVLPAAIAPIARAKRLVQINWLQDLYPEIALGLGLKALQPVAPLIAAARNASLKFATFNVAIGERMSDRLKRCGAPPGRIRIIPNWCEDEAIHPLPRQENRLREAWGLQDKFIVGYSGNLGRAHEYATLLDAAERFRDDQNIIFLFIGGGHLTDKMKREIEQRGLASMFQFRPYQEERLLPLSLSIPDVHWISLRPEMEGLIVPSKFYGIAAAGRPTIAVCDPAGEISTLVERHDCGIVVEPGDGAALAAAIRSIMRDPQRGAEMGRNAREMLDRSFSRLSCLQKWEDLFAASANPR
jgi:colanic acid biosynthesis glycosyl transferase WcaI